ncbi:MAG: winged helix-turn-helix domain-containing protein [Dermatophilaceae bacterium]
MLRQLTARPGEVIDRATLLAALPGDGDMHALDVAVARLRAGMGEPNLIQTIIKRGYRLDVTASPRSPRPGT